MAKKETAASVEVCNNAYERNQLDLENGEGPGNEVENYFKLDCKQRCIPSPYQKILSPTQTKKAEVGEKAVTSKQSEVKRGKYEHKATTKMPPSHLVLAISSLFMCIFCWPAAPCAVLATIYGMQVSRSWRAGHHRQANLASGRARELARAALVCGAINTVFCFIIALTSILTAIGVLGYFSKKVYINP